MRALKLLLVVSSVCGAAPARAQGAGDGATAGAWSDQLIDNPQTLPQGALGAAATVPIYKFHVPAVPPSTTGTSLTIEGLALEADYGITDKITAGVSYLVDLHDDGGTFPSDGRWKGPLEVHGALNIVHEGNVSVTAGADFRVDLSNSYDKEIHAGLAAKYMLSRTLAVYTGNPVPLGPAGQHLSISLASNHPITFALPVGIALQALPQLFAYVDTTLADVSISHSSNQFIFSDFIPVDVGALFRAAKDVDLGVTFSDDLENAGGAYTVGLTARLYMP